MSAERAVVVGASLAGVRAAEALRRFGHDGPLALVGAEPHRPYDRPPLSKQLLTGEMSAEAPALAVDPDLDADWHLGTTATGLDLDARRVRLAGGGELPFDRLVIATGAAARTLPGFTPRPGLHLLRTLDDALRLREDLAGHPRVAVVGAGFIGLEVAASCRHRGLDVTVLEALPVPLARAVGAEMGAALADLHRRHGVDLRLGVTIEGLVGEDRAAGVRLGDGSVVAADAVVVGVGAAPATGWLAGSGVDVADGVLCDERLRVLASGRPRPDVVAAGDVARWAPAGQHETVRVEHWTNAVEQGEAAARTLVEGDAAPPFAPVPYFWSDQHGSKIQFVGATEPGDTLALEGDPAGERFVAAYGRAGRLVAALGFGRPARVMTLQRLIGEGAPFPPPAPPQR